MEGVFEVFVQHWMKEENQEKKKVYLKKIQEACVKIIQNRTRRATIQELEQRLLGLFINGTEEEIEQVFWLWRNLGATMAKNREMLGLCSGCRHGLIRVRPCRFAMAQAVCESCNLVHYRFEELYFFPI